MAAYGRRNIKPVSLKPKTIFLADIAILNLTSSRLPQQDITQIQKSIQYKYPLGNDRLRQQIQMALNKSVGGSHLGRPAYRKLVNIKAPRPLLSMMKFVIYNNWQQLPESAHARFAQGEKVNLFFSRPWLENVAATLDDAEALLLACVISDGNVLAILPLIMGHGNTCYSLKHRYTSHYSLLLADDDQQRILTCLAQGLSQWPIHSLLLEPIADNDSRLTGLHQALATAGYHGERHFRHYNWIYRLQQQSYVDYLASRPARLRNTIVRKKRKLHRDHGYKIRLFSGDEVPLAMSDYYLVYNASWKANEQYVDFLDGVVAGFSQQGWSRLAVLYVCGQPVAAQLWFVLHGKASIFRLAYDEAWKQYSPGSILTSFLMEYVIDTDKVDEIDFLTGNDAYKQDWMSERRECFALSCVKNVKTANRHQRFIELLKSKILRKTIKRL